MATRIDVSELARSLADVLERVRDSGETFVVEQGGQPLATIVPSSAPIGPTPRELAEQLGSMHLLDPDFADDLAEIHGNQPPVPEPRWDK